MPEKPTYEELEQQIRELEKIEIEQRRMNIHAGVYVLAAIYVLQEADKKSLVEINPRSAPRDGNYYIRYNFSLTP